MIKAAELRRLWDCVIIGAGPAGALAAKQIALQNKRVLLIDKAIFPRAKVCGCCLNISALAALEQANLEGLLADNKAIKLNALQLFDHGRSAQIALPFGSSLSRDKLDLAIINAARDNGAQFLPGTTATVLSLDELPTIQVACSQFQDQIKTKLIIIADGLAGHSLDLLAQFKSIPQAKSRFGAGLILDSAPGWVESGKIYMACGSGGYVGMVKLEDGRLNIALAFDRSFSRQFNTIASAAAHLLEQNGLLVPIAMLQTGWRGTDLLSRSRSLLAARRLFIIGDACGYTEPFTGEGMAWALWSGLRVVDLAIAGIEAWDDDLVHLWHENQKKAMRTQLASRLLAYSLRNKVLRHLLVDILALLPEFGSAFVREMTDVKHTHVHPIFRG